MLKGSGLFDNTGNIFAGGEGSGYYFSVAHLLPGVEEMLAHELVLRELGVASPRDDGQLALIPDSLVVPAHLSAELFVGPAQTSNSCDVKVSTKSYYRRGQRQNDRIEEAPDSASSSSSSSRGIETGFVALGCTRTP